MRALHWIHSGLVTAAWLLTATASQAEVIIVMPTATESGKIEFKNDISFVVTQTGFVGRFMFNNWKPVEQDPNGVGFAQSNTTRTISYTINGGPVNTADIAQLMSGYQVTRDGILSTLTDGYFFVRPRSIFANAGDLLVLKATTYVLDPGSWGDGVNLTWQQTFTGDMYLASGTLNPNFDVDNPPDLIAPMSALTSVMPRVAASHWLGQTSTSWSAANWASNAAGNATTATPTAADDITFAATGAANQLNTNLDAAFTIKSLTVNGDTGISTASARTLTVSGATSLNALLSIGSGVTLQNGGDVTVSNTGTLAGGGSITAAVNQSIFINGALSVGDPNLAPAAETLSLTTSGTGAVVMGAGSVIAIDLLTGAGSGGTGTSGTLSLSGTLNATAGGTLRLGNPNAMTGFAGGDQWQVVGLNSGAGAITGTLAVNDAALALSSTQTGSFDQATGVYRIVDAGGGLQTAAMQDQGVQSAMQGLLGDINGHVFSLHSGGGEGGDNGGIAATLDEGVVVGEGDGPEGPLAFKTPGKYRWEVFTTVNYANVSLSSIGTQNGAETQSWSPGIGIQRYVTQHLALGFAASLLETHQSYTNGAGSLDMEGVALTTYASYVRRSYWLDVLYSFGRIDLDAERHPVGFPTARGETTALTNAVQLNGGWRFRVPAWKLVHGPFAGVDWLHVSVDGYSESGGGLAALAYANRSFDSMITRVGWSVSREFETDFAVITPQLRLSYERQNIERNNGTSATLLNLPMSATNNSQSPGQDYVVAGAGINLQFSDRFNLLLTYQTQLFRQDLQAHYGGVRFGCKF